LAVSPLTLQPLSGTFAVCRLAPDAPVPTWASAGAFYSVTRAPDELSVVCPEDLVPAGLRAERGWSCLQVEGPLDLSLTGVLASLAQPLAEAGVSVFAVSTFDTDYLLIRDGQLPAALPALTRAGHRVRPRRPPGSGRTASNHGTGHKEATISSELAQVTLRPCTDEDFEAIYRVVNEAARAYRRVIPEDRWHEPYMPQEELRREIATGVRFWGAVRRGELVGVMGIQDRGAVDLIRHAYVLPAEQGRGVGSLLLRLLESTATRPLLVGTWAAAVWAVSFYQKHGYRLLQEDEKNRLLRAYWQIPSRQVEASVVLAHPRWREESSPSVR